MMALTKILASIVVFSADSCCTVQSFTYRPSGIHFRDVKSEKLPRLLSSRRIRYHRIFPMLDTNQQQPDEWLNMAAQLREEVRALEATTAIARQSKNAALYNTSSVVVEYTDIADSVWTLSYRFAGDPESPTTSPEVVDPKRRFFGGKLTVKFRKDGYTDLLSQESVGLSSAACKPIKAWGWDIELSKDNNLYSYEEDDEYILFSIDVELPPLEKEQSLSSQQRFYFQARKVTDSTTGVVSFVDGTVTVKRDIVEKTAIWGFFSPAGILAQFRYVGGFILKPGRSLEKDDNPLN
jgi:hypothetical protein